MRSQVVRIWRLRVWMGKQMRNNMKGNDITIIAITLISCIALFVLGVESKEIAIGAISGLVGYLTKANIEN